KAELKPSVTAGASSAAGRLEVSRRTAGGQPQDSPGPDGLALSTSCPVSSTRLPWRRQPSVGPPPYGDQVRSNHTPNAPTQPDASVLNALSTYLISVTVKPPVAGG